MLEIRCCYLGYSSCYVGSLLIKQIIKHPYSYNGYSFNKKSPATAHKKLAAGIGQHRLAVVY